MQPNEVAREPSGIRFMTGPRGRTGFGPWEGDGKGRVPLVSTPATGTARLFEIVQESYYFNTGQLSADID